MCHGFGALTRKVGEGCSSDFSKHTGESHVAPQIFSKHTGAVQNTREPPPNSKHTGAHPKHTGAIFSKRPGIFKTSEFFPRVLSEIFENSPHSCSPPPHGPHPPEKAQFSGEEPPFLIRTYPSDRPPLTQNPVKTRGVDHLVILAEL